MAVPEKVRDFINEQRQPLPPLSDLDEPLGVESIQLIRLVAFLETEIGFVVPVEQLVPQNFENLRALERMLEGKGTTMD